ncbi:hypothetical protein Q3G72_022946 [Acer saccharum]|nr:hypothetical protein Q3G72_022946 [Acer saccharum]
MKTKAGAVEGDEDEGRGDRRRRRRRPWRRKEIKAKAGAAMVRGEKERRCKNHASQNLFQAWKPCNKFVQATLSGTAT